MKLRVVTLPANENPLRDSPGFEKKGLSTHALDIMGLCEYGCRYCSSNAGNFLRIRRETFADETERQLGERLYPSSSPELTFHWPDVLDKLRAELDGRKRSDWGSGKTMVFSMLTDGFSPGMVASGTTRAALDLVLARTAFRIRVLTKNACVGSSEWIDYFLAHRDRFVVGLSIGTLDNAWSKRVEINTSPPSQRLKSLRRLQDAGVPTYGMLCPIFPDMLDGDGIEQLLEAIQPRRCETVWAEPYNDRANWQHVQAGYETDSDGWRRMQRCFGPGTGTSWSEYATELLIRLRRHAEANEWTDKLVYLLYEQLITAQDAQMLRHLGGVSLQSAPMEDGRSRNAGIRRLEPTWP